MIIGTGREPEGDGEAFLALGQRGMGAPALLKIDEGEEHAGFVADLDRLPGHDDEPAAATGQAQLGLARCNHAPGFKLAYRLFATLNTFKNVDLVERAADQVLAVVAGQLEKTAVDLDKAEISKATY